MLLGAVSCDKNSGCVGTLNFLVYQFRVNVTSDPKPQGLLTAVEVLMGCIKFLELLQLRLNTRYSLGLTLATA